MKEGKEDCEGRRGKLQILGEKQMEELRKNIKMGETEGVREAGERTEQNPGEVEEHGRGIGGREGWRVEGAV